MSISKAAPGNRFKQEQFFLFVWLDIARCLYVNLLLLID